MVWNKKKSPPTLSFVKLYRPGKCIVKNKYAAKQHTHVSTIMNQLLKRIQTRAGTPLACVSDVQVQHTHKLHRAELGLSIHT